MTHHLTSTDAAAYTALVTDLTSFVHTLPAPLPTLCLPLTERLCAGSFSPIAALLPTWLSDLVPITPHQARHLGLAQLCGWWFVSVQDDLLDGAAAPHDLLGAHLALLHAVEIFRRLGVPELPCWPAFAQLAATTAAGYATEISAPNNPATYTPTLIAQRAALLQFALLAQLDLASIPHTAPLRADLAFALDQLVLARQLSDDATDWAHDLRRGRLNLVSAAFARELPADALDLEHLAGRQVIHEPIWSTLAQQHAHACATGLERLAPYGSNRLSDLIRSEAETGAAHWATLRTYRAAARQSLGL